MKRVRERAVIPTLIAVFTILMMTPVLSGVHGFAVMGEQQDEDPYREFALEILLNPERITYDMALFDEYAEEGHITMVEVGMPVVTSEEFLEEFPGPLRDGFVDNEHYEELPPGKYYYHASHIEPQIVVMISEVRDTRLAEPHFPGIDLDSLSISFIIPTKMETYNEPVKRSKLEIPSDTILNETIPMTMEQLGYFTHPLLTDSYERIGYAIEDDNISIMVFNRSTNDTLWSGMGSGIIATFTDETFADRVDADVKTMMNAMGLNNSLWTGIHTTDHIERQRPVEDYDGDHESILWDLVVTRELEWLDQNGFIDGITEEDVLDISSLSTPGASGINYRIVYDNGSWKTFDEIGIIPILGGGYEDDGSYSRFNIDTHSYPIPPDREPVDEFPEWIVFAVVGMAIAVILFGVAIGYARHQRNELLNNLNRKKMFEIIKDRPGIHFSELQRELELKQGVLSYHLNVLEKNEFIKSIQDGTFRRFYLYDDKIELEFRLHEMQQKILMVISQKPGITQSKISKALGRNKMVINYHLKILLETGILHMEREGRETHCYIDDPAYMMAAA